MKKSLFYILTIVTALSIAFGPFTVKIVHAQGTLIKWALGNIDEMLAAVGSAALKICSLFLWLAGQIFDKAIDVSINNPALGGTGLIEDGWAITRDLANLSFIFILIYIGISTILQIAGHGMKELLIKVVIIALLVNFSMLIANTIIDASNILANEFYKNIVPADGDSISAVFVAGLEPQTIYKSKDTKFSTQPGGVGPTAMQIIIISVFGCALVLITSFVLFAGAILFLIRSVTLSLLVILAPLAFVAMALPKTKQFASQWWEKLFNQAFFAPAFLFLFYLVAKTITSKGFTDLLGTKGTGFADLFFGNTQNNVALAINFIVLIILMLGCLTVAKFMGGAGATSAINFAQGARKRAQGYAGKISKTYGKRYAGRAAAAMEGKLEKSEGGFAKTIKAVPLAQRGLARVAQLKKKEVAKYEKQYKSYDPSTLEQLKGKFGTTAEAKTAMEKIIKKKKKEREREKELEELDKSIEKGTDTQRLKAEVRKRNLLQEEIREELGEQAESLREASIRETEAREAAEKTKKETAQKTTGEKT